MATRLENVSLTSVEEMNRHYSTIERDGHTITIYDNMSSRLDHGPEVNDYKKWLCVIGVVTIIFVVAIVLMNTV